MEHKRTRYRTFMNINERTPPVFMSVHLTKRTKFLVPVHSFNELLAKRFTNRSLNVQFICSPR
ncbi:hypothetical protein Hanom_Chr02g00106471 [Helianthus anomalus]